MYIKTIIDGEEHPVAKNFSPTIIIGYLRPHNVHRKKQGF